MTKTYTFRPNASGLDKLGHLCRLEEERLGYAQTDLDRTTQDAPGHQHMAEWVTWKKQQVTYLNWAIEAWQDRLPDHQHGWECAQVYLDLYNTNQRVL